MISTLCILLVCLDSSQNSFYKPLVAKVLDMVITVLSTDGKSATHGYYCTSPRKEKEPRERKLPKLTCYND